MEQQLIEDTINIVPQTMDTILPQIMTVLAQKNISQDTLEKVVKSLFYGLWNFDKMINQHNLSTKISLILHKIPKKTCFHFLQTFFKYLYDKWNLIDHHRINKFMQLVRYLMREAIKIDKTKTQNVFKKIVFSDLSTRSGLAYHVVELYHEIVQEVSKDFNFSKLSLSEYLIMNHSLEHFRSHIIEKVYEKHKQSIFEANLQDPQELQNKLNEIIGHIIKLAQSQQKDENRKSLYNLVGYLKSDQIIYEVYFQEKQEKAMEEKIKKKKKISKHKKELIREAKKKRKQKNKRNKKSETISKRKFQIQKDKQIL